ncbi:putative methionine aminopeptidase, type I [Pseudovirgaria hyperparasitica]|uniref:Methionine aminopeptidase n=1 Tax=Pseudovirgaria hyperparasitica TaxID=470096 RepID=A0A6A6WKC2_9PEZI|nr:putative methionine aminopeptidase, type I [Pseudovirgaria hyperparasitica]KAF2762627.1 putative methionine aminopeptidase, type I [Pseudovirgaria hyperparasitica]
MTDPPPAKRRCLGTDCENDAGDLQCPSCLKLGTKDSYFCSQDCFKRNWATHKVMHKTAQGKLQNGIFSKLITPRVVSEPDPVTGFVNPFPAYPYTGSVRPVYPLSAKREVPKTIPHPDWSETGIPKAERRLNRTKIELLDAKGQEAMRKVSKLGREVLDITAAAIKPGVTTDYLDEICHNACVEREAYPSPLNYNRFPKSLCTSPNEVVCHGIPDHRKLEDGDIINLDISLYHGGYHSDLNETYYVGDKAKANPDAVRVIETTRECLQKAIELVKPGCPIRDFGPVIEKHAKSRGCSVMATWGGHGINTEFHPPPWIPHYAKNRAVGTCKPGMTFTIEPILTLGRPKEVYWPDNWTNVTVDGKFAAQFEDTLLVTETGVEVLTARLPDSPGGPIPMPTTKDIADGNETKNA